MMLYLLSNSFYICVFFRNLIYLFDLINQLVGIGFKRVRVPGKKSERQTDIYIFDPNVKEIYVHMI